MHSLRGRIAKGLSANLFGQLVTIATQLVGLPIFLTYWGTNLYGEWLVLTTLPTYLSLSDLGFANAAANEMTMLAAKGRHAEVRMVYRTALMMICGGLTTVSTVLIACSYLVDLRTLTSLPMLSETEFRTCLILLLIQVWGSLLCGVVFGAMRSEGRYGESVFIGNFCRLAEFAVLILAVASGVKLEGACGVIAAARIVSLLVAVASLARYAPHQKFSLFGAKIAVAMRLLPASISFLAMPVANGLFLQGFTLLVGVLLGPPSVVVFSALRTMTRVSAQFMSTINYSLWPEISRAAGGGDFMLARKLHLRGCQVSAIGTLILAAGLAIFGEALFRIWTHGRLQFSQVPFDLLLLATLVNSLWFTSAVVPIATNRNQKLAVYYLVYGATALVSASFLIPHVGLGGAAGGVLIGEIVMAAVVLRISLQLLKEPVSDFFFNFFSINKLYSQIASEAKAAILQWMRPVRGRHD